jgi:hypothetical protein
MFSGPEVAMDDAFVGCGQSIRELRGEFHELACGYGIRARNRSANFRLQEFGNQKGTPS